MKQKNKDTIRKTVLIVFLAMVVLGFTVPGFLFSNQDTSTPIVEPRLCQSDADCYLTCDDLPTKVLCAENLCQQNACDEYAQFPFTEPALTFDLTLSVNGSKIPLASRLNPSNYFTKMDGDKISLSTPYLPLKNILERHLVGMNEECLLVDSITYCSNGETNLTILVNGEVENSKQFYAPQEGDKIEISYE